MMNRDSAEAVAARCLAEAECPPLLRTLPDDEVDALFGTLQSLKSWASGGLDMWPPSALKAIPRDACRPLAWLFYAIEHSHRWPRVLLDIRVQLIPKTTGDIPPPSEHRPISVTSAWYRLWSAWVLRRLLSLTWASISETACGGLPHRSPLTALLYIMLHFEGSHLDRDRFGWFGVASLDAVKCFDLLSYPLVYECAKALAIPRECLATLVAYWCDTTRYLSAHAHIEQIGFQTTNGVHRVVL